MWCTPVHMLRPPLGCHVCHLLVADMTEEETSIHQVSSLGLHHFSVQLLLQLLCQRLITVLWFHRRVGADGLGRASWEQWREKLGHVDTR